MHYQLPLNNLNTFAAAAEHLSFQEAAKVLYVTPSAVSHQIRNLEKLLGYKLFERLDKRVTLTQRGQRLFTDIQTPLKQIHEASRKALRGQEDNNITLSIAPAFATGWLLPRLRDFNESHPDISLSVIATTAIVDFRSDPFDASIRMGKGRWDNTVSLPLFGRKIVAVCLPSLLERHGGLIDPRKLNSLPLIQNAATPNLWEEWCQSAGVDAPAWKGGEIQVQNSAQVVEAVQSGEAIGLVDRNFFPQDLASGRLTLACEHVLKDGDGYYLVYPEAADELPSLRVFREWIGKQLGKEISPADNH